MGCFVRLLTHCAADCTQISFAMRGGRMCIKKPVWYHINSSESPNAKFVLTAATAYSFKV